MSKFLESRKGQLLAAKVNVLALVRPDAQALLEDSIAYEMATAIERQLFQIDRDDREGYIKRLVVAGMAAVRLGTETTLGELADWLRRLVEKYPAFNFAAKSVQRMACDLIAEGMDWIPKEIALLTEEVKGQVQYLGDVGADPIRQRINHHVAIWLMNLFQLMEERESL